MTTPPAIRIFLLLIMSHTAIGQPTESAEQALLNIEDQHLLAMINHSHDVLTAMYDDQFHGVLASGNVVDKVKVLEFLESGSPHVLISIEEVKATVFGTLAVTTGKVVSKGKSGFVIGQSRFLRVYVKKGDQWKIVESQTTVIIKE